MLKKLYHYFMCSKLNRHKYIYFRGIRVCKWCKQEQWQMYYSFGGRRYGWKTMTRKWRGSI